VYNILPYTYVRLLVLITYLGRIDLVEQRQLHFMKTIIITEIHRGFPQFSQANAGIAPGT
jgi:hypothetical protein